MSAYPFATTGGGTTTAPSHVSPSDAPNPFAGLASPQTGVSVPSDAPNPFAGLADSHRASKAAPVSYTHLTLPTTPYV